jgi:hypothetical protein
MSTGSKRTFEAIDAAAEADGRRVQQRRFSHQGASSAAPQQAATVAASSTLPAPPLHRHALESVFAFCSLPGLTTAQLVSRSWHSAVRSMRSVEASVHLLTPGVTHMIHSPLHRHVARLTSMPMTDRSSTMAFSQLALIQQHVPHLRALDVCFDYPADASDLGPIRFPTQLEDICVSFSERSRVTSDDLTDSDEEQDFPLRVPDVIDAAASLNHLHSFRLFGLDSSHELAPLQRCASLRALYLSWTNGQRMSEAQAVALRNMQQLEQFVIMARQRDLTDAWIQLLSAPPYPPLQSITEADDYLTPSRQLVALLPHLPSLNILRFYVFDAKRLQRSLASLPSLHTLQLCIEEELSVPKGVVRLARAIRACRGLQSLTLTMEPLAPDASLIPINSALMASCIGDLTHLHTLDLSWMQLGSLSFLSRGSLPRTLTALSLTSLEPRLLPEELVHVFKLKALQDLTLSRIFGEAIPKRLVRHLRPRRSRKLPSLLRSNVSTAFMHVYEVETEWESVPLGMCLQDEKEYEEEDKEEEEEDEEDDA